MSNFENEEHIVDISGTIHLESELSPEQCLDLISKCEAENGKVIKTLAGGFHLFFGNKKSSVKLQRLTNGLFRVIKNNVEQLRN